MTPTQVAAPSVAVIVLNWNGRDDTLACLRSLDAIDHAALLTIVVDNGSVDGSVAAIAAARWRRPPEIIETGSNLGYAGGNNVGIEHALARNADFVLVLNNDTVCAPDLISRLLAAAARHPQAGFFCPRMYYLAGDDAGSAAGSGQDRVWFDGARWNAQALYFEFPGQDQLDAALGQDDHDTAYACGAALFVRASVVRQVGMFDAAYFLVWEESDWCYRARRAGWSSVVVPSAHLWHRVGASFGTEASPLRTYFSFRNRLLWLSRHGTVAERARALAQALHAVVPSFDLSPAPGIGLARRFAWAWRDWWVAISGGGQALEYLAKRRALLDFLGRRLGPPPAVILDLNQRWLKARRT